MLATIEIPLGSKFKYEIDKQTGRLKVDRLNSQSVPANYGFIENTLSADGDPTDCFVITEEPLAPLCQLTFEAYYLIEMIDNGKEDNKFVGVIAGDKAPTKVAVALVIGYLQSYKDGVEILGIQTLKE